MFEIGFPFEDTHHHVNGNSGLDNRGIGRSRQDVAATNAPVYARTIVVGQHPNLVAEAAAPEDIDRCYSRDGCADDVVQFASFLLAQFIEQRKSTGTVVRDATALLSKGRGEEKVRISKLEQVSAARRKVLSK